MTHFPNLYILQVVKSLPFHVPEEAWKRYPIRAEAPRIGHHREDPLPPPPGTKQNPKKATSRGATTAFPGKWRLRKDFRNSTLMTCHYSDLGGASDWMTQIFNQSEALPRFGYWRVISSDIILRGNQRWRREMSADFSGWRNSCLRGQMGQLVMG